MVVDRYSSKKGVIFNLFAITFNGLCALAFIIVGKYGFLAYLMTFMWGF